MSHLSKFSDVRAGCKDLEIQLKIVGKNVLFLHNFYLQMSPLINKSVDDLLVLFEKTCVEGKPFNIHK